MNLVMFWSSNKADKSRKMMFCYNIMIWIKNSDVQIFQIYGHTTRIPDFRVIGPSENRLKSDMSDSPDFYISEIRGDRFTDFCVHTARLSGNRLQKVGRLEKIGQWDHGIRPMSESSRFSEGPINLKS